MLARGTPLVVDDVTTEGWSPAHRDGDVPEIRSCVGVAIAGQGRAWGIACALSGEPGRFSAPDSDFVQAVANVLATVIERDRIQAALSHQALHDPLTGLANRSLLLDRIESALAASRRSRDTDVVVHFVDLDEFKQINDSLGHGTGDELLREVARRLQATVREEDTVGRFGGDEFVIATRRRHDADVLGFVGRVQAALREPYELGGSELRVTASIGVATSSDGSKDAESLLRDADAAMFRAKRDGRDRCEVLDKDARIDLRVPLPQRI